MKLSVRVSKHDRPRERLLRLGASALQNTELLAIALRTGVPGLNVLDLSSQLLDRFRGLRGLLGATPEELLTVPGLGTAKACALAAILELAKRAIEEELTLASTLDHPSRVKQYCKVTLAHRRVEHCIALYLDSQLRLIASGELARGTLSQASVYPREVGCARPFAITRRRSSSPTTTHPAWPSPARRTWRSRATSSRRWRWSTSPWSTT